MLDHIILPVSDVERSLKFYQARGVVNRLPQARWPENLPVSGKKSASHPVSMQTKMP